MNKAKFNYKKEDGTVSVREVLRPSFLKEATNSLKDFKDPKVKYIHGMIIQKENLTPEEIIAYEKTIEEYYTLHQITLNEFLEQKGLDPSKLVQRSFFKTGVDELEIL